jgi:phosphoribosyl 1,2-cyclic phosphodiesterase
LELPVPLDFQSKTLDSLFISSIASGSNGNCYYIGNSNEAVLIDVGVSCREVVKRMDRSGLSIGKVKAIFISHEHIDHIRGVEVLSRKYRIPVYITENTRRHGGLKIEKDLHFTFSAYDSIQIGDLFVTPFPKFHDAVDPFSFTIEGNNTRIAVLTDIGSVCEHVIGGFRECHAAFLETNYDEQMLETGRYPFYLKRRISGDKGHLSNHQALELFLKHRAPYMSQLILSHLSKENNTPELAEALFKMHAGETNVVVASRYEESAVFQIQGGEKKKAVKRKAEQTSLF